jgi:radical SAM superfamily enzyme YgiQ (UPF0313 family)
MASAAGRPLRIRFVFPRWRKLLDDHEDLKEVLSGSDVATFRMAGLGLATAAGAVPEGHAIACTDENVAPLPEDLEADLVALSFFTPQAPRAYEVADACRRRGVPVVAGGIHPTALPREALERCDAVVRGPAEGLWPRILDDLRAGRLRGRVYEGRADAPFAVPRRDLFSGSSYLRCDIVQTARGCPAGCGFCVLPCTLGAREHRKDPAAVARDVASLRHLCCFWADESLLFDGPEPRAWRRALRRELEAARVRRAGFIAVYPRFVRALADEDWEDAAALGLRQVYLVLGLMGPLARELRDPGLLEAVDRMHRHGIDTLATFTLGHDADPPEDEGVIAGFCARTGANLAEFTIAVPFPGTPRFERLSREGRLLHRDWSRYNGAHAVFAPLRERPEDLEARYRRLWRGFYGRLDGERVVRRYARGFGADILRGGRPASR